MNLRSINATLIDAASQIAPWLAALPTAWSVGHSVLHVIKWDWPIAVITGAALEMLGLAASDSALTLYSYNLERRKTDPDASRQMWIAVGMVGVYFGSVIILTAVLEANPVLALFPVLSLVGTVNLALRKDHANRLDGIAEAKRLAKLARHEKPAGTPLANDGTPSEQVAQVGTPTAEHGAPLAEMANDGKADGEPMARQYEYADFKAANLARNGEGPMSVDDVVTKFGTPKRTAYRWVAKYEKEMA